MFVWAGDGVVAKGPAYGMRSIRVDGNDTLAMYATVKAARKMAVEESRPILIEVKAYQLLLTLLKSTIPSLLSISTDKHKDLRC